MSSDFAIGLTPGWHSTIFPPFFVAGAIFSGLALVVTLIIPARAYFDLGHVITARHLDNLAKLMLATGLMVSYGYLVEYFVAWYSGDDAEIYQFFVARPQGPNAFVFYVMLLGNVVAPQFLWSRRVRRSIPALLVISLLVNAGMWSERFVIVVMSLQREFMVSAWATYRPTLVDLGILSGTLCFFSLLFLLFLRFVPFVPLTEVKELRHELALEGSREGTRDE